MGLIENNEYLKTLAAEVENEDYDMSIKYPKYSKVAYKTGQDFKRSFT